jgi:hypothetical protein
MADAQHGSRAHFEDSALRLVMYSQSSATLQKPGNHAACATATYASVRSAMRIYEAALSPSL